MKRKVSILLLVLLCILPVVIGCQKDEEDAKKDFTDGTHTAELEPDDRGWKSTIDITVSDGKITKVDYDEVNDEGKKKSQDKEYSDSMKGASGVAPAEAYDKLEKSLLSTQNIDEVETVTGATGSSDSFKEVSKKALNK